MYSASSFGFSIDGQLPSTESRVPTEQDVAFAQKGYEVASKAHLDALLAHYGTYYYHHLHSMMARGRLGSELRRAWDACEIAQEHYLDVWNDYLRGRLRDFP